MLTFKRVWAALALLPASAFLQCRTVEAQNVVPGLEVLIQDQKPLIEGRRVGLITNHTAVDRRMRHAADLLANLPGVRLTALFAPEHGIRGAIQAGGDISTTTDPKTGTPIYSLYGETRRPTPEMLTEVDILLYDIQDVGVRFYTYISTMGEGMEAAADKGIPFVILDRPNPVTAARVEGSMIDLDRFRSFVGAYRIPVRYGLTIGELGGLVRAQLKKNLNLVVVKMKNYRRDLWYDQTGLQWIAPSPNIPSVATAMVYPGMCLFEGTNVSEARGTTQPFEMIGAPWIDGEKLADELTALNLPGVLFRPASFTPTFSKYEGQLCRGVQVHVANRSAFEPLKVALHILSLLKRTYPGEFSWRTNAIDRLSGTDQVRLEIDKGTPVEQILASWQPALKAFDSARRPHLLY
jgi:uncharacterized protein YbbC (DUF1343 family)